MGGASSKKKKRPPEDPKAVPDSKNATPQKRVEILGTNGL